MKSATTIMLIFGLAGAAFLGVFAIGCDGGGCGNDTHQWCFAAQAEATSCPGNANLGLFLNFHLGALKVFSNAVFGEYTGAAFVAALELAFAIALAAYEIIVGGYMSPAAVYLRRRDLDSKLFLSTGKFHRWLSLHENSPAYS